MGIPNDRATAGGVQIINLLMDKPARSYNSRRAGARSVATSGRSRSTAEDAKLPGDGSITTDAKENDDLLASGEAIEEAFGNTTMMSLRDPITVNQNVASA